MAGNYNKHDNKLTQILLPPERPTAQIVGAMLTKAFSVLFLIFLLSESVWALPARVLIIRHAEKPVEDSIDLSLKGFRRASALTQLFEIHPEYAKFGLPDFMFAARYVPGRSSMRSVQTLSPLSYSLGLDLNDEWTSEESKDLGNEIRRNPEYNNKVIMLAWKHSEITTITEALKAPCKSSWASKVYDRIWIIDFKNGEATCKDSPQSVLPDDSDK